jgi:hypothetical protein
MELLRRVASFGTPVEDLKIVNILFIRSILEQSATVWHSSCTEENSCNLERVQKSKDQYNGYLNDLLKLGLEDLNQRRQNLCLEFTQKCTKHDKLQHKFPKHQKEHSMETRCNAVYKVQLANTSRLQNSAIIYMQKLFSDYELTKQK